jgi:predicted acylesterase/phospholipase RssA
MMQYDMVFEGGGAKGMVFVGALQELEARAHTPARLMGASAGAIMATFLAAGYTTQEMSEALNERQDDQPVFLGFLETPPALTSEQIRHSAIRDLLRSYNSKLIPDMIEEQVDDAFANLLGTSAITARICSFIELGGFFAAQNFLDWLELKLNSGVYPLERGAFGKGKPRLFGKMNLAEFHQATGVDLSLIGSDTSDARILVLNHRTAPDCPVRWAVRMSMSFPLLWHEVVWQPEWGRYLGRDLSGHTVVDGGMLSNFPIELFLSDQEHILRLMGEKSAGPLDILGFLIDEALEVPGAQAAAQAASGPAAISVGGFKSVQRVMKLINTMTQAHDKIVIDTYEKFVIRLPAKGYGTIEFGMSDARRNALVEAGRQATRQYFERLEQAAAETPSFGLAGVEPPPSLDAADRIAHHIFGQ